MICSPFFPYLALTIGLNLPPTIWGVKSLANVGACDTLWLLVNAIATAFHMVAAFYIVHKIQTDDEPVADVAAPEAYTDAEMAAPTTKLNDSNNVTVEEGTQYRSMEGPGGARFQMLSHWTSISSSSSGRGNSIQRLGQVMCYDAGVAVYIIVFCAWMVWQSIGMSKVLFGGGDGGDDEDVCEQVEKWVVHSVVCGVLYLMLVCCAFGCSALCLR